MPTALRIATTAILATLMVIAVVAAVGDERIWSSFTWVSVVPYSIGMWLLLAIPLSMMPVFAGVYFGLLSPFFMCMLFPLGFLVLAQAFPECCFIGMLTGLLVSTVWRYDCYEDIFP